MIVNVRVLEPIRTSHDGVLHPIGEVFELDRTDDIIQKLVAGKYIEIVQGAQAEIIADAPPAEKPRKRGK